MYVIVWLIGIAMAGMSLPIYLICWVLFGVAGGYLIGEREMAPAKPTVAQPATLIHSSEFGRVPPASVVLLTKHVRSATGPIISVLPERTSEELRSFTIRAVLDRMLRDWWENGNKDGLTSQDIDDLKSFVAMAVAMAAQPTGDPAHNDELSQAIYRATLSALLDDWLVYWNADGVDGPPRR
ncbi:MAG: hypothetical protein HGA19_18790 [Oscillochloris sp.]|nr:hypothetical protein [Oscillochloris sp.]